jgi:hypothetical protein
MADITQCLKIRIINCDEVFTKVNCFLLGKGELLIACGGRSKLNFLYALCGIYLGK